MMPLEPDDREVRYAEYVLGVLDARERAAVERESAERPAAAAAIAAWSQRLAPLAAEIAPVEPPERVWDAIRRRLRLDERTGVAPRTGLWENLRFWHWLGLGSAGLAATAAVVLLTLLLQRPTPPPIPYMAATIVQPDHRIGWTATMDIAQSRMIVIPGVPQRSSPGHAPELWLVPKAGRPIPVGMISDSAAVTIALSPSLVARLGPTATLAVSIEPVGGSPTGRPTGPVIGTGAIGAATAAASRPA
ncbi:MAG: anti-sigma factor [Gammaproteobacteria bacterium]|nr:anti-sigma factor [Gammaproteobacteria bacterium]